MDDDTQALGFDPDALREKYRHERDKRLREDGAEQYIEMSGAVRELRRATTRTSSPGFTRAAVTDEVEVAIIGGGFSGLLAGARLTELGVTDFRIIEAGGDFGGTWYWNRYPGRAVRHRVVLLPAAARRARTTCRRRSTPSSPEIFEHSQRIGQPLRPLREDALPDAGALDRLGRRHQALAHHAPTAATTSRPASSSWRSARRRGPSCPGIPGIDEFEGHSFHTSRWDYDYTGGDTNGGMTRLADKRVAIIGTGATAIQCVPRVGAARRAPLRLPAHAVVGRLAGQQADRPGVVGDAAARLAARAARELRRPGRRASRSRSTWSTTRWTDIFRNVVTAPKGANKPRSREERAQVLELADFRKMNQIRQRVDDTVQDPDTAEALKPYYRQMCKRPTFNDEYLACFNQDNVTLVDVSEAKGVERITPNGRRGQRRRVRGRLHHLRIRLRDLGRLPAPARHRDQRPRRRCRCSTTGPTA